MDAILTRYEALLEVRRCFDSETAMGQFFDVSQPTVWRWLNQSKQLPGEHVLKASELTGIPPYIFRPDLYPRDLGERFYGVDQYRYDRVQA